MFGLDYWIYMVEDDISLTRDTHTHTCYAMLRELPEEAASGPRPQHQHWGPLAVHCAAVSRSAVDLKAPIG